MRSFMRIESTEGYVFQHVMTFTSSIINAYLKQISVSKLFVVAPQCMVMCFILHTAALNKDPDSCPLEVKTHP